MVIIGKENNQMGEKRKAKIDMSKNCAGVHEKFELKTADKKPVSICNANGIIRHMNFLEIKTLHVIDITANILPYILTNTILIIVAKNGCSKNNEGNINVGIPLPALSMAT
ncbi:hypothetical protein V4W79_20520 [Bacillus thuringiensis]